MHIMSSGMIMVLLVIATFCVSPLYAATANEIKRDGRFIAYDNGTVLDTKTNLMWAARDNGEGINWSNAKSYCENYRGGSYADWRMPTTNELAGLYDRSNPKLQACYPKYEIYLTNLIDLSCCCPWASETSDSRAAYFYFDPGRWHWDLQSNDVSHLHRALPVRSGKKEIEIGEQKNEPAQKPENKPAPSTDARHYYEGIKGIALKDGTVIYGQILSINDDVLMIRTKEGKISSYSFMNDIKKYLYE